ncbi:formate dehydrogenase accessory sulfurtransferase FdhD [Brucella sp. BE17]|uniref:formate dehydrogenase accessory sulfurtransferase FdhD n=1 Tax=Brucella sp. BE17 TaxID=3142977 RepID=UPI0031BA2503
MTTPKTSQNVVNLTYRASGLGEGYRIVAEEAPVALSYNGSTQAVLMATPSDLHDLAVGFSLTEGIIRDISEIERLEVVSLSEGIDVQMWLDDVPQQRLAERRRFMAGPVGCGLCGIDSIDQAMRPLPALPKEVRRFHAEDIGAAMLALTQVQSLNSKTRAVHGAGFYVPDQGLVAAREDVGRHNALDKLVGGVMLQKPANVSDRGWTLDQSITVITSRVSVEMVQKAVILGTPVLAAISAPTALAIRTAEQANLTLVAVVRGDEFDIYTHGDRIIAD